MQRDQSKEGERVIRELLRMHVKSWLDITAKDLLKATLINYGHA
jgi:hypothetical protein